MAVSALPIRRRTRAPELLVSIVIPCLNEARNIEKCVTAAYAVLDRHQLLGEVVVVDNGSEDGSAALAEAAGATVVHEPKRGYGSAYRAGFAAAAGEYIVMIDADLTYDFEEIPRFIDLLESGSDLVMGNRMSGIQPGAMSFLSRLGNPLLSGFLNVLYKTPVRDAHCGMRAFRREILPALDLHSNGMEFASEMVIRAARANLDIQELPIALHPRGGDSKLSPFRDGWRHLRLMLSYNPSFLFLLPGAAALLLGAVLMVLVLAQISVLGHGLYIHTLIAGSLLVVVGTQLVGFGLCGRTYCVNDLGDRDPWLERMQTTFRLEHGLLLGGALTLAGVVVEAVIIAKWISRGLGSLNEERIAVVAATLVITGVQIFFTSFLLSILGLRRRAA